MEYKTTINTEHCSVIADYYHGEGMMATHLLFVGDYDDCEDFIEKQIEDNDHFIILDAVIEPNEDSFEGDHGTIIRLYHSK